MCGIAGVVQAENVCPDSNSRLMRALAGLSHRGPDDRGEMTWVSLSGVRLDMGMTRLAVLDLQETGQQPMTTRDGRYTIVFNGEITNFVEVRLDLQREGVHFRSSGDTEVLLSAWEHWGPACRHRLDGMYAFAILDRLNSTLSLVRDPFGIKPLYVTRQASNVIAFGSEVRGVLPFLSSRPALNWGVAARYLSTGLYDDTSDTFVEGISQLTPGSLAVVNLVTGNYEEYVADWRPTLRTNECLTLDQAAEGVRFRLMESVQRNMRADVPVGLALSGGIDSTAIAHLARALEPERPLQLFSYVAPGTPSDESQWIQVAWASTGGELTTIQPDPLDLVRDLDELILAQGEPFASTSIYAQFRVFQAMSEAGIVVSLDGQGGDEVFAGYHGYPGQRVRSLLEGRHWLQAAQFLGKWSRWPGRSIRKGLSRAVLEYWPDMAFRWPLASRLAPSPPGLQAEVLFERAGDWLPRRVPPEIDDLKGVRLKAELRASLLERGLQSLLRHGDRNSMHWSVESRVPFLDRALVDFSLSLPEPFLVDPVGTSKKVLRQAMTGIVPDEILMRRDKIGFEAPSSMWLEHQRPALASIVHSSPPVGFLETPAVVKAIRGDAGHPPVEHDQIWRLINLYRWAELMGVDAT